MSSVSSSEPRLGVSGVFFHGSGLPHIGMPFTIASVLRPTGGKTMTSNLACKSSSLATRCVLMYVNGTRARSNACRHQPSVWVVPHVWTSAIRGARSGCALTAGAESTAVACSPRSDAAACMSAAGTFFTMNEPRANFRPAASNGSSAASIDAFFSRYRSVTSAMSALWLIRNVVIADCPTTPPLTRTSATFSAAASSTLTSVTRTACTLNSSGNVHPVSS